MIKERAEFIEMHHIKNKKVLSKNLKTDLVKLSNCYNNVIDLISEKDKIP